MQLNVMDKWK